jgi:hypothetical protein
MKLGRKFTACLLGAFVILVVALAGKMDGNLALCLSVVIGGFYTGDAAITRAAIKHPPALPGSNDAEHPNTFPPEDK